jgi:hypothetical protein
MRTFVCLSAFLGLAVFLTIHYSFWLAIGIMYIGGMLIVALIAFAGRSRQASGSNCVALDDKHWQMKAEGETASEELKAA